MHNKDTQSQVDSILFEEGSFSPLSWLLREGYLDYHDYQDWKKGFSHYLEDHFKIPVFTLISALEEAKVYADLLNLEPFQQSYPSIENQSLKFCRSATDELIFTTVYEPAQDRIQMDLFFDSADSCSVTNLINAIVDQRSVEIPDLMAKLEALNPDKYRQFGQLLAYQHKIVATKIASEKKIEIIIQKATPLAFDILGRFTHDFLTPLWHKLSEEVAGQQFDSETPYHHLSFTAFKEFQWQQVLSSIEREKNWNNQPLLIFRYAEACFKLNREREGINHWFRLFVQYPDDAERLVNECCQRLMIVEWQHFSELDPELENTLFPACVVMNRPALAQNLDATEIAGNEPLQLIAKLVNHTNSVIGEVAISQRARLQHISPELFNHYMSKNLSA